MPNCTYVSAFKNMCTQRVHSTLSLSLSLLVARVVPIYIPLFATSRIVFEFFIFVQNCILLFYSLYFIQIKMLDYRQKRLQMEPLKLNDMPSSSENLESLEFRRVVCKGVFDDGRSIYIGPRSRSISGVTENGYYVITPLMPITDNTERYLTLIFLVIELQSNSSIAILSSIFCISSYLLNTWALISCSLFILSHL